LNALELARQAESNTGCIAASVNAFILPVIRATRSVVQVTFEKYRKDTDKDNF